MGLLWALGGASVGGGIELLDKALPGGLDFASRVDMWPQTLAIPGFLSGVLFATLLMLASLVGGRSRSALTPSRFVGVGAVAGALLGALAVRIGAPVLFVGISTLWGVLAASGSLWIARRATTRELLARGHVDLAEERLLAERHGGPTR